MGRRKKFVDNEVLLQMRAEGKTQKEIAMAMGVSVATIARRIAFLKHQKGILTKYRELQGLQLTAHQSRILEAADAKDFSELSLVELINALNILSKAEISIRGKESVKIRGLVEHLIALENIEKEVTDD